MDDNYRDMLEALHEIDIEVGRERAGQLESIIKMGYPINGVPEEVVKAVQTAQEAAQIYWDALFELGDAIAATEQPEPPIPMEFLRGASAVAEVVEEEPPHSSMKTWRKNQKTVRKNKH